MLSLKLGLSLNNIKTLGGWQPTDETSVVAWYKQDAGITFDASSKLVSQWSDSANSYDMVQSDNSEKPEYDSVGAGVKFDGTDDNLQTSSQITLSGAFTIGFKCNVQDTNNVLIADNTINNEMFKITSSTNLRVKIDNNIADLTLGSGSWGDGYIVVTRDASNNMGLWHNGVDQSVTETLTGTADIDAIGVRNPDLNAFEGKMYEIQIFSSESAALTSNVNNRLSNL